MSTNDKDTIYIDVDDEITSIIDKVKSSTHRIVALVLPKRATMLQSSVNLKLLKRAAEGDKKQLVLITTEAGLLPLAGAIGVFVAKNLQSKPEIPAVAADADATMDALLETEEGKSEEEFDPNAAAKQPVGELASSSKAKPELTPRPIPRSPEPDDAIELDNSEAAAAELPEASKEKKAKNKKLKIPDFNKFRLRLIIGAAILIALIVGWILANIVLPKATVTVFTKTSNVNSSQTLNLQPNTTAFNASSLTVPSQMQQTQKTSSGQVATTGQKNEGQIATGTVNMTAQVCNSNATPSDVPAGVGVSANGLTFITQSTTHFSFKGVGTGCINYQANKATPVTAQSPGSQYNVSPTTFAVSYQDPNNSATTYSAQSSTAMSGGTDNIVNVVTQADIDNATQKIVSPDTNAIKTIFETALKQGGWYPIPATFSSGTPSNADSASVGTQANTVTVTETITYTMFGAHQKDLDTLITNNVNSQIDTSKQTVQNDNLGQASFTVVSQSATGAQVTMQATSTVGPNLNVASLKKQIAGQKSGEVQSIIETDPGVTKVTVHYSPFWVSSTPKNISKIVVNFKKS